jgi:hypothetical protein
MGAAEGRRGFLVGDFWPACRDVLGCGARTSGQCGGRDTIVGMAAVVTGSKTVTVDVAPTVTAAVLTALMATAPENLTVGQLHLLYHASAKVPGGSNLAAALGAIFP